MPRGRPTTKLVVSEQECEQLEAWTRSPSLPQGLAARSRIVLLAAQGVSNQQIAARLELSTTTVAKWRRRFLQHGIGGLYDEIRPGRPRTVEDEQIATVLKKTVSTRPTDSTHWSCRQLAGETGLSKSSVHRIWRAFGLKPHRFQTLKLSTDPFFVEKVRDVVGLYLDPPTHALVLSVDEKSQCQALERSQPALPLGLGYVEGYTHDYLRHGTTTLFAALDVATGQVLTQCKPRHRHQEFLQFLRYLDANVTPDLAVHLILDNYAPHKHQKVRRWLLHHPRFQFHFIPTYSSWLNQVEAFFSILTRKAIRRGSFTSVQALIARIDQFVAHYNENPKPFIWTASADSVFEKLERLCERISGTEH
jgi:putative transposase